MFSKSIIFKEGVPKVQFKFKIKQYSDKQLFLKWLFLWSSVRKNIALTEDLTSWLVHNKWTYDSSPIIQPILFNHSIYKSNNEAL